MGRVVSGRSSVVSATNLLWLCRSCALGRRCRMLRIDDLDVGNLRRTVWPVGARIGGQARDPLYHIEVLALPENRVLAVEVRRGNFGDEELRAVGVRPTVGHRQAAGLVEGQVGAELILKAISGISAPIACRIATLDHEVRDDAMADGADPAGNGSGD